MYAWRHSGDPHGSWVTSVHAASSLESTRCFDGGEHLFMSLTCGQPECQGMLLVRTENPSVDVYLKHTFSPRFTIIHAIRFYDSGVTY